MRVQHNLARLRKELHQTQAGIAGLLGVSLTTIKSIETLKLALSESLARRIAAVTGADIDWLLDGDLEAPMPPLNSTASVRIGPEEYLHAHVLDSLGYQLQIFSKLGTEAEINIFVSLLSNCENELKKIFGPSGPAKENRDRLLAELKAYDPDQWKKRRHQMAMKQHEATLAKLKAGPQGRPKPRRQARSSP
jgi:transcriptional regulator with XRE-family HTH domain